MLQNLVDPATVIQLRLVFGGAVNRSNFYFLILLFTSLHVSASTGLPQVKYTLSFLKDITPITDPFFRLYSPLFQIILCNIL
jgi:hypothetical protein